MKASHLFVALISNRMMGREADRRATSLNPAAVKADGTPM
jgi:hypothetical protein